MSKSAKIIQLPDHIANQIAAGEVIEGPAAAVKELVENSIDAGAKQVHILLEDGGRRLIEVNDDGNGIRSEQLPLALGRHATSKLRSADDLFRVASLGFRGEALPSIAAVSEFWLASRASGAEAGQIITVVGGEQRPATAMAMPPGTRVTVRNLFWNVPARLKFLKSARAETSKVSDAVTRLALGHPHIAFSLRSDGRVLLELAPVKRLPERIKQCFGATFGSELLTLNGSAEGLEISGLVAHPRHAKPSTKRQFVFLNGRHIRDRLVIAALREGYHGHLEPRLHPSAFIHLDINPTLVDVNVHPTKAEVRFRNSGELFSTLKGAIQQCLNDDATGHGLLSHAPQVQRRVVKSVGAPSEQQPLIQERFLPPAAALAPNQAAATTEADDATAAHDATYQAPEQLSRVAEEHTTATPSDVIKQPSHYRTNNQPNSARIRQIVQLRHAFILVETDTGIQLIDQHALHEKILYLALDPTAVAFEQHGVQELLIPKHIDLTATVVSACEPHLTALTQCGIKAEVFGPSTILLRSFPLMLARTNWEGFFIELAEHGSHDDAIERLRDAIAQRKACRAAVKAGDPLTAEEQAQLVELLLNHPDLDHCPHGRPTTLDLGWPELERRFQR